MLRRDTKASRPASWWSRAVLLGLLGALALGVSALRGPAQSAAGPPAADTAPAKAKPEPSARHAPFVFGEVRADSAGIFAFRPAAFFRHPSRQKLADDWNKELQSLLKQAGLDKSAPSLTQIEQVTGYFYLPYNAKAPKGARHQLIAAFPVIRTTPDYDWVPLFEAFRRSEPLVKLVCKKIDKIQYEGKTYYRLTESPMFGGIPDACLGLLDRHTLIVGQEKAVQEILRDGLHPAPAWARDAGWERVEDGLAAVALDNRKGQCKDVLDMDDNPPAEAIALAESKVCAVFGMNWTKKLKLDAYVAAGSEREANQLAKTIQVLLVLGRHDLKKELARSPKTNDWELEWARQLLQQARIERGPVSAGRPNTTVQVHSQATIRTADWIEFLREARSPKK
jgi:hypothetical protein